MRSWPATASRSAARKSWRGFSSGTHTLVGQIQAHDTRRVGGRWNTDAVGPRRCLTSERFAEASGLCINRCAAMGLTMPTTCFPARATCDRAASAEHWTTGSPSAARCGSRSASHICRRGQAGDRRQLSRGRAALLGCRCARSARRAILPARPPLASDALVWRANRETSHEVKSQAACERGGGNAKCSS